MNKNHIIDLLLMDFSDDIDNRKGKIVISITLLLASKFTMQKKKKKV